MSSSYTTPEPAACPDCHYIGPRRLCGCQARLGQLLKAGDLPGALAQYEWMRERANYDLRARTVRDAA